MIKLISLLFGWMVKQPIPTVYVSFKIGKPFGAITLTKPAEGMYLKVSNITFEDAAKLLPGKTFNWSNVPPSILADIELRGNLEISFLQLTKWIK